MKKIILTILVIIALIAVVTTHKNNTSEDTFKIGITYGLTGAAATWTEHGLNAVQMAVNEINEDGGINGKHVELIVSDSETVPQKSVSSFYKARNNRQCRCSYW